ncbi:5-oxoprolinase subunit PxpB [Salipaludibacillus sp. LMS25]|jgi:inhibitor of KinA|uniref:5-oxoprolinase subunit PxpB n=1 Tax=Salipaludibacillus sp. LMS25 TaxID=2924031 RepID=UPI0020D00F82|nr:5-oxoprolinase subunit PxpB [Salipaludibacillus sp. LMS25]UTR16351.1 5-oxoprolinase subunit PxpB [Salipaludibacillus sp. LMS25]
MYPIFSPLGDRAIRITFSDRLTAEANDVVRRMYSRMKQATLSYMTEMVPGYVTLTMYYAPEKAPTYKTLIHDLRRIVESTPSEQKHEGKARHIILPILYGGEKGVDLEEVAHYHQLTPEDVIKRHSASIYHVYMMGFSPGFPYLGGMDETIATPRRQTPRGHVEAGSVGIAGAQTGVYSIDSPGGWQIIGHTPVKLFDKKSSQPTLLQPGDRLSFKPVTTAEYDDIIKACKKGIYKPEIELR